MKNKIKEIEVDEAWAEVLKNIAPKPSPKEGLVIKPSTLENLVSDLIETPRRYVKFYNKNEKSKENENSFE